MRLAEAKPYNEYYAVMKIDGFLRNMVTKKGTTKFGYTDENDILVFKNKKDAKDWIERNSYNGMSWKYEIAKIRNTKESKYKWEVKK